MKTSKRESLAKLVEAVKKAAKEYNEAIDHLLDVFKDMVVTADEETRAKQAQTIKDLKKAAAEIKQRMKDQESGIDEYVKEAD